MKMEVRNYYKITTFDKYILKEIIKPFLGALLLIILMTHITEIMERLDFFMSHHVKFFQLLLYYLYKTPFLIIEFSPVALLFAVVFTLGMMAKNKELIAIISGGVSFYRVVLYLYIAGFLFSIFLILFNNIIVVRFQNLAYEMNNKFKGIISNFDRRNFSMYGKHNFLYHIGYYNNKEKSLYDIEIIRTSPEKDSVLFRIDAKKAVWNRIKKQWCFYNGIIRYFNNNGDIIKIEEFKEKIINIPEKPKDFAYINKDINELTIKEALRYINKLKIKGFTYQKELVDFHLKFSFPFTCLIMMLIGAPLSFYSTKSVVILSMGLALLGSFLYWMILSIGFSLGKNGVIPPFLAAWLGNIIFLIVAFFIHKKIPA